MKLKQEYGKVVVFCVIRKKWVLLTPEEKVRQYLLDYFINELKYPLKYISVEKQFKVNQLNKRYDIVVYNTQLQPSVLVECKANSIQLNQQNLQQLLAYNIQLRAPYLILSNGTNHLIYITQNNDFKLITTFPSIDTFFS